jgi:hypothetical protein
VIWITSQTIRGVITAPPSPHDSAAVAALWRAVRRCRLDLAGIGLLIGFCSFLSVYSDKVMKRREFITLVGSAAAAWPLTARGQQADQIRRVGLLMNAIDDADQQASLAAFLQALQKSGWMDGHTIRIDTRWAEAMSAR